MNIGEISTKNRIIAICVIVFLILGVGGFFFSRGMYNMGEIHLQSYDIGVLKGRPYKVPLFDKKILKLSDGKIKFDDDGKEFQIQQFAPLVAQGSVLVFPAKLSNNEGKTNYFLTLYVKEGNNFNQRQNVLLGADMNNLQLDFNKEILRVRYDTKNRDGKEISEEKFFNTADGKFSPYFPYIDNGAIDLTIIRNKWNWKKTQYSTGEVVTPKENTFVIGFDENGNFSSSSDCQAVTGKFVMTSPGSATFGNVISKDFECKNSLAKQYANMLLDAQSFTFTGSTLSFGLKTNSGSMIFETSK